MSDFTYTAPLSRGFNRMKGLLFQPFRFGTWIIVGFAAFLGHITESFGEYSVFSRDEMDDPGDIGPWVEDMQTGFLDNLLGAGTAAILIPAILAAVLLLIVIFAWVEARGKFVFLENVVQGRGAIQKPWAEYNREGNSLFIWKLVIDLALYASVILAILFCLLLFAPSVINKDFLPLSFAGLFIGLWIILLLALLVLYLRLFMNDFVVPIMYKHRISFGQAWSRFLGLLRKHPGEFLLYGLFVAVLLIGVCLVLGILGAVTCCIGFLVMSIPYVGSVILLPIHATYRAFSAEFLAQFGPEFDVWEGVKSDASPPGPAAAPLPPPGGAPPPPPGPPVPEDSPPEV